MISLNNKYLNTKVIFFTFFCLQIFPYVAHAQFATGGPNIPLRNIFVNLLSFVNDVIIPFIIGIGFLVFVWGMFRYFIVGGANDDAQESGKSLMIYATLGFLLIIVFWGVVNLLAGTTGLQDGTIQNIPKVKTI